MIGTIGNPVIAKVDRELEISAPPLEEQRRIVTELDAEVAQMEAARSLLPRFEARIAAHYPPNRRCPRRL